MSAFDVAIVLTLGSAAGRVITGSTPTLAAGIVMLFTLRWLAQVAGRSRLGSAIVRDRPVLLMAGPHLLEDNMTRARVAREEVLEALRIAGARNRKEVACVVLEATGAVSVTRRGAPLDRGLFARLRGADRLPGRPLRGPAGRSRLSVPAPARGRQTAGTGGRPALQGSCWGAWTRTKNN